MEAQVRLSMEVPVLRDLGNREGEAGWGGVGREGSGRHVNYCFLRRGQCAQVDNLLLFCFFNTHSSTLVMSA